MTAPEPNRRLPKGLIRAIAILAAMSILAVTFHGNQLIDHIPIFYAAISGVAGFLSGLFLTYRIGAKLVSQGIRGYFALIMTPLLLAAAGTYYCRLIYEAIAFTAFDPSRTTSTARVDAIDRGKWGGPWAYVVPEPGSRELQVKITSTLREELDPYRNPGRDCLILPVEIGRFGIRRAILPAAVERGMDVESLTDCRLALGR